MKKGHVSSSTHGPEGLGMNLPIPHTVTTVYAEIARCKTLRAHARDPAVQQHYLDQGRRAADTMMGVRSAGLDGLLLKLVELQEWMSEDAVPSQKALVASLIADVEAMLGDDTTPIGVPLGTPLPRLAPGAAAVPTGQRRVLRVNRSARPVTVDGVHYPSIAAAAIALGVPYAQLRRQTWPSGSR